MSYHIRNARKRTKDACACCTPHACSHLTSMPSKKLQRDEEKDDDDKSTKKLRRAASTAPAPAGQVQQDEQQPAAKKREQRSSSRAASSSSSRTKKDAEIEAGGVAADTAKGKGTGKGRKQQQPEQPESEQQQDKAGSGDDSSSIGEYGSGEDGGVGVGMGIGEMQAERSELIPEEIPEIQAVAEDGEEVGESRAGAEGERGGVDELGQGAQEAGGSRLPRRLGEEGAQGENDEGSETDAGDAAPTTLETPQRFSETRTYMKRLGRCAVRRGAGLDSRASGALPAA